MRYVGVSRVAISEGEVQGKWSGYIGAFLGCAESADLMQYVVKVDF